MEEGTLQGFQELNAEGRRGQCSTSWRRSRAAAGGALAYHDRNLPKMCSFWVRQTCTRVVNGACPFRPCNGQFRFPELASRHPDQLSALVRRLHADGAVSVMRDMSPEMEELRELIKDLQQGSRDQAIRNRYHGTEGDKLAEKYLERASKIAELTPPDDEGICSLWVGGITPHITQQDLHDAFYPYGEVAEIKLLPERRCAFVTTPSPAAEERRARSTASSALGLHSFEPRPHRRRPRRPRRRRRPGRRRRRRAGRRRRRAAPPGAPGARAHYPSMNPSAMGARPDQ